MSSHSALNLPSLTLIFRCISFLCLVTVSATGHLRASENILLNSGFEDPADFSSWNENNWAKLDATFLRDEAHAHSGKYSQKITINRAEGVSDLQLAQAVELNAGESLQISFWARGFSNSAPVSLQIRQRGGPYKIYFSVEITATEAWVEHVYNVTLPSSIPEDEKLVLLYSMSDETTLWLDDISLSRISGQSDAPTPIGNQLRNGSFEVGIDGWVATFRESGGVVARKANADENNIKTSLDSMPSDEAPDGERVMVFEIWEDCSGAITSGFFPLRYGYPVTVGFWMKTSVPGLRIDASLGGGTFPNMMWSQQVFKSKDEKWNYYSFTATPKPNSHGTYVLQLFTQAPGVYEIDKVTVVDNTSTVDSGANTKIEAGFERVADGDIANIYHLGDRAEFILNVKQREGAALTAKVIDVWDHVLAEYPITALIDTGLLERAVVEMPTSKFGGFKCSVYMGDSEMPIAEVLYTVLPELSAPAEVGNSYFGGHAQLTPYNLHIASKMGYRWLRLFPPLVTQWMAVEPQRGEWNFDTRGVARAKGMGFKLLAGFSTTPEWAAGVSPKEAAKSRWWSSWPPEKWSDWQTYVQKTQEVFAPYVETWEIWNEPDGKFLQVPRSQDKPEVYVKLLTTAAEALQDVRDEMDLIAGAVVTLHRPFTRDVLDLGASQNIDYYSFHYYGGYVGERSPDETTDLDEIKHIRSFKNRDGEPLDVWVTEAGVKAPSWLKTMRIAS